jgi:hypothetical protein
MTYSTFDINIILRNIYSFRLLFRNLYNIYIIYNIASYVILLIHFSLKILFQSNLKRFFVFYSLNLCAHFTIYYYY